MSHFDNCFLLVIGSEGADTNDPDDPGGYTRFGIAQNFHPHIDVRSLTLDQAKLIYRSEYWNPIHGDELPPPLSLVAFDGSVVPGLGWTIKAIQIALHVTADGVFGPKTLDAARAATWKTVLSFTSQRLGEFERQIRITPSKTKYGSGWRDRALRMFREAVKLEV